MEQPEENVQAAKGVLRRAMLRRRLRNRRKQQEQQGILVPFVPSPVSIAPQVADVFVRSFEENSEELVIADFGCGDAQFLSALQNELKLRHLSINCVGFDVDPVCIEKARETGLACEVLDMCDTSGVVEFCRQHKVSAIFCFLLPRLAQSLREILRNLPAISVIVSLQFDLQLECDWSRTESAIDSTLSPLYVYIRRGDSP
ncbi:MAG: hypothetical protein MHM6MM_005789 [Cercozoa sp. M6MM]